MAHFALKSLLSKHTHDHDTKTHTHTRTHALSLFCLSMSSYFFVLASCLKGKLQSSSRGKREYKAQTFVCVWLFVFQPHDSSLYYPHSYSSLSPLASSSSFFSHTTA